MIIIKFFGVNNFNKIFDSTESLDLTKKNNSHEITISAYVPMTTLVLNHILKFKILYILGFILLFILLLPITWPCIYTFLHILIAFSLPNRNFYIFEEFPNFLSSIDSNFKYRLWLFKFRSSSWLLSGCNKPSAALNFFFLDKTSSLKDLKIKKERQVKIMDWPENESIDDELRMKILEDILKINYYYLVAKHCLDPQIDKNKPIDWSELDHVTENYLTDRFQKINSDKEIVWKRKK